MQTIFLSDLKAALLEHPQAWITQMEQQHNFAPLQKKLQNIGEPALSSYYLGRLVLERPLPP